MEISAGKLWGLRRLADDRGLFRMLAIDQRPPIMNVVRQKRGTGEVSDADVAAVKRVLAQALAPHVSAVLLDPIWAYPAAIDACSPRQGLIITLEHHEVEEGPGGRKSRAIPDWSVGKIRRLGGDAVKALAWFRPDAALDVVAHQKALVRQIGEECRRFDLPFVFELLVYPLGDQGASAAAYAEDTGKQAELVLESVRAFAGSEYAVDVFKLESPIPAEQVPDPDAGTSEAQRVQALFDELGRAAGRPWVMLSAGAGKEAFKRVLTYACRAGASGFLAGRTIWWQAFQQFPDLAAMVAELRADGVARLRELNALTHAQGTPWHRHPAYGDGPQLADGEVGFPRRYGEPM